MTQRIPRRTAATTALAALAAAAIALTGCASWQIGQRAWAHDIEQLPGVQSLELGYSNNWPSSGVQHRVTLVLSPDITEAQARKIAIASCAADPWITSFDVSNTASVVGERRVEQYDVTDGACVDADELARFAQVTAAMTALGPAFNGNFGHLGWLVSDPSSPFPASAPPSESYRVFATATAPEMLVDALRELDARITDVPLSFGGAQRSAGALWNSDGPWAEVWLTPQADLARLEPALTAALATQYTAILATDDTITLRVAADADLGSPEIAAFREAAQAANLRADVTELLLWTGDPEAERAFLAALESVPGGATLSSERDSEVSVQTNSDEGMRAAAELLVANGELDTTFHVRAPGPGVFTVTLTPSTAPAQFPAAAYAAAEQAHAELPDAERIGFTAVGDERRLWVNYPKDASRARMKHVRATLEPITDGDVFSRVVVQPDPKTDGRRN